MTQTSLIVALSLFLPLTLSGNILSSLVFAQFPPSILPSINLKTISSSGGNTITIQSTKVIQGSSISLLKTQEAMLKKAVVADISNAVLIAKGNVTSKTPVRVNAQIINQLANNRVSTTEGIDFTKTLVATELANVINALMTNSTTSVAAAHTATTTAITKTNTQEQQLPKVVVDSRATCTGSASHPTGAACAFTISIHG